MLIGASHYHVKGVGAYPFILAESLDDTPVRAIIRAVAGIVQVQLRSYIRRIESLHVKVQKFVLVT